MLGEALVLRVIEKSNPTLTFLYQKIGFGMFSIVDFSVMPKFNLTIIMFVLRGTQIWQKKLKDTLQITKKQMQQILFEIEMQETYIKWKFQENELDADNSKVQKCFTCTVSSLLKINAQPIWTKFSDQLKI